MIMIDDDLPPNILLDVFLEIAPIGASHVCICKIILQSEHVLFLKNKYMTTFEKPRRFFNNMVLKEYRQWKWKNILSDDMIKHFQPISHGATLSSIQEAWKLCPCPFIQ